MSDTDRNKELVSELASNQEKFRLLVECVKEYAIYMIDANGIVVSWNTGAERIKGYSADEIIGKHISVFYPPESKDSEPQQELAVTLEKGSLEQQGWRVRKDGTRFWANITITPVYQNSILVGYAKVTRDLTERQLATQNEQIFRLLVGSVKDYAIFMLDPRGLVLTWNEGAERIKGYKAAEIIGQHFSKFYPEDAKKSKHPDHELEVAKKEGRYEEEGWRIRKDGSLFWASVVITAIYYESNLIGFAKVTRDLTERRLADQEREMAAKTLDQTNTELRSALEVKSRLVSTISHEVRTPMSAIIGMAEVLTTEDLGEDHNQVVHSIFDSSRRLLLLLNNLLESARMEAGNLTVANRDFPVRAVLGDIRELINRDARAKNLRITGTCDAQIPETICGDELKVRQVLLNLAHNAVKFTEKGEVDISAEVRSKTAKQMTIRFSIRDSGIGIKSSDRNKLFLPFSQADDSTKRLYGGTGLGLSISKQLVDLMGGSLDYESKPGTGSTFWCEIQFSLTSAR